MEPFLIGRAILNVDGDATTGQPHDLSALAFDDEGCLWLASDETTSVERLHPLHRGVFGQRQRRELAQTFDLPDPSGEEEIDIEGMDVGAGRLWLTGSHTSTRKKPKGKNDRNDLSRLATVTRRLNRHLVGCLAVDAHGGAGPTARLPITDTGNTLTEAMLDDEHLGTFLGPKGGNGQGPALASKENGFDVEGLAVRGTRVMLGLRGPVLRGWAVLLEIEPVDVGHGVLALQPIGDRGRLYRKHFVELDGMGLRDLAWRGNDLLLLTGPTMDVSGPQTIWRLNGDAIGGGDTVTSGDDKRLTVLFDVPTVRGADKAEGMAIYEDFGEPGLMIVYDAPSPMRRRSDGTVLADVFRLDVD